MQDLLIVFPLTMLMGTTDVAPALTRKRPSGNLFAFPVVSHFFDFRIFRDVLVLL